MRVKLYVLLSLVALGLFSSTTVVYTSAQWDCLAKVTGSQGYHRGCCVMVPINGALMVTMMNGLFMDPRRLEYILVYIIRMELMDG
jgi:hypothetical protein